MKVEFTPLDASEIKKEREARYTILEQEQMRLYALGRECGRLKELAKEPTAYELQQQIGQLKVNLKALEDGLELTKRQPFLDSNYKMLSSICQFIRDLDKLKKEEAEELKALRQMKKGLEALLVGV